PRPATWPASSSSPSWPTPAGPCGQRSRPRAPGSTSTSPPTAPAAGSAPEPRSTRPSSAPGSTRSGARPDTDGGPLVRTDALEAGRRVVGALVTSNHAELVEVFGHLGYDFVFLDAQHGGLSVETARELIRAAELTGMTPLVRVPRNDPAVILEYLDSGAGG